MKELYLVRHAKSSWSNGTRSDFDRPLNGRGKKDAPVMGRHLKISRGVVLDRVICSTAKRARTTAKRLLKGLDYPFDQVVWEEIIYSGTDEHLLKLIRETEDVYQRLMLIGHNPYITDLGCYLSGVMIDDMPTCAVLGLSFDISAWGDVAEGNGQRLFFDVPKTI